MSDERPIGVFDSGLGGLTVVRQLIRCLPHENIVYFGDTGRVPYGNRSRETIQKYALQDEDFLMRQGVKLIIAACGTVSSMAPETGDRLPVPFFEVVSHAVKAALKATRNGRIGVLGTAATVASEAHKRQILALEPSAQVIANACPLFVPLVEDGIIERDDPVVCEMTRRYLQPLVEAGVDTVILGCTHYPILRDSIADYLGANVVLIDSGAATAEAVRDALQSQGLCNSGHSTGMHRLCISDRVSSFARIASLLLGEPVMAGQIERVDMDLL